MMYTTGTTPAGIRQKSEKLGEKVTFQCKPQGKCLSYVYMWQKTTRKLEKKGTWGARVADWGQSGELDSFKRMDLYVYYRYDETDRIGRKEEWRDKEKQIGRVQ